MGDHIRKRRMDLGLSQRQLGEKLGVRTNTVYSWESGDACPRNRYTPEIIQFLGYDPVLPMGPDLSGALSEYRLRNGLTQAALAQILGVNRETVGTWERGRFRPNDRILARISALIED